MQKYVYVCVGGWVDVCFGDGPIMRVAPTHAGSITQNGNSSHL